MNKEEKIWMFRIVGVSFAYYLFLGLLLGFILGVSLK